MNHPKPEELTEFLYGDTPPAEQPEIARHLDDCPECRHLLASWRATRVQLQSWKLPGASQPQTGWRPLAVDCRAVWRWAAAAVLMAGIGFALARLTLPASDPARLRAELSRQISDQLTQQLKAELTRFALDQSLRQQEYEQAIAKTIGRFEAQHLIELASLRRDVETVAVNAQDELDSTREGLYDLAASEPQKPKSPNQ